MATSINKGYRKDFDSRKIQGVHEKRIIYQAVVVGKRSFFVDTLYSILVYRGRGNRQFASDRGGARKLFVLNYKGSKRGETKRQLKDFHSPPPLLLAYSMFLNMGNGTELFHKETTKRHPQPPYLPLANSMFPIIDYGELNISPKRQPKDFHSPHPCP